MRPFEEPAEGQAQVPIVPISDVTLVEDLTYEARPLRVVELQMRQLRSRLIPQVRIQWDDLTGRQDTWEFEAEMRRLYPELFEDKAY